MIDFLSAFTEAADRFAGTLAEADLAATVPSCPGWTVGDLGAHLGNVHAWAEQIVRANDPGLEEVAPDGDLVDWYVARADRLRETLAVTDPARETWNFAGVGTVAAFWPRRQTHETTMHTVDLDLALGALPEIDPVIAEDGVLEALEVFGPRMRQRGSGARLAAPVTLAATDTGTTWTLVPRVEAAPRLARADEEAAVAARVEGTAAQLLTVLWKRRPASVLRVIGDDDVAQGLLASRLTA